MKRSTIANKNSNTFATIPLPQRHGASGASGASDAGDGKKKKLSKAYITTTFIIILLLCPFYFNYVTKQNQILNNRSPFEDDEYDDDVDVDADADAAAPDAAPAATQPQSQPQRPPQCTQQQKSIMEQQLPADECKPGGKPWLQKCSITKATKCPDTTWFDSHYQSIHANLKKYKAGAGDGDGDGDNNTSASTTTTTTTTTTSRRALLPAEAVVPSTNANFVAIYVGCNKGYDAVNALRMGTGDAKYNKSSWEAEMGDTHASVCQQNTALEFPIESSESESESESNNDNNDNNNDTGTVILDGTVHCIEPASITADKLKSSASVLGWDDKLLVTQAAMAKEVGVQYFTKIDTVGVENKSFNPNCPSLKTENPEEFEKSCDEVPLYTVDYYMEEIAPKKKKKSKGHDDDNDNKDARIHLLSIDVEGYDYEVMKGAKNTLARTEYLEFEYNWMGPWADQNLIDAVKMLDDYNFTCYWAGVGRAWRIDESCWLDHFSVHFWSNVACVNRVLNPKVAENMEETFIKTLEEEGVSY